MSNSLVKKLPRNGKRIKSNRRAKSIAEILPIFSQYQNIGLILEYEIVRQHQSISVPISTIPDLIYAFRGVYADYMA